MKRKVVQLAVPGTAQAMGTTGGGRRPWATSVRTRWPSIRLPGVARSAELKCPVHAMVPSGAITRSCGGRSAVGAVKSTTDQPADCSWRRSDPLSPCNAMASRLPSSGPCWLSSVVTGSASGCRASSSTRRLQPVGSAAFVLGSSGAQPARANPATSTVTLTLQAAKIPPSQPLRRQAGRRWAVVGRTDGCITPATSRRV